METPNVNNKRLLAAAIAMKEPKLTHVVMHNLDVAQRLLSTGALLVLQELEKDGFFSQEQAMALGAMIANDFFEQVEP